MNVPLLGDNPVRSGWDRLHGLPGGKQLFSKLVGSAAPYTGNLGAIVEEVRYGYARATLRDRRAVRNHLDSIHAIALVNFGEMASGVGFMYSLPPRSRAILTRIKADYLKKSRGTLTAECAFEPPTSNETQDMELMVEIQDESGDTTCIVHAFWRVGPVRA